MININLLYTIWNKNKYDIIQFHNYIKIYNLSNTLKEVIIINDISNNIIIKINANFYKNCFIKTQDRHNSTIWIYIHEDYIKYILRQRLLNYLLND
jgi:hypothetical protein